MNNFYVYLHRKASDNSIFYVGKGKGFRAYRTSGRSDYWNKKFNKHGLIVEILFKDLIESEAFRLEIETIKNLKESGENIINLTNGGEGMSGHKMSNESLVKMSLAQKNQKPWSDEARKKMSDRVSGEGCYWFGRKLSEEHRKKISVKHIGKKVSQDVIDKIKKTLTGKKKKEGSSINYSNAVTGVKNPNYDDAIFNFINIDGTEEQCTKYELRKKYNLDSPNVSRITNGKAKSHKGWSVKNEDTK